MIWSKGKSALTLQAQLRFKILDSVFYCSGGNVVDDRFLDGLPLAGGFKAIIRQGSGAIGLGAQASITACTDSTITINDSTYHAVKLALPFFGPGDSAVLVIVDERPAPPKR